MKPRKIKLMTDYGCFPLWDLDNVGNIDPSTLPLSASTISGLTEWARAYDDTLNAEDPASSGFRSRKDELEFERQGLRLWELIASELTGWDIQ